jgi:hypothetical protein
MFKWNARWMRGMVVLASIAAFVISAGAGWRW